MSGRRTIFVEGGADKRFLEQFLEVRDLRAEETDIVVTKGWTNLCSPATENTYLNEMRRTTADGGTNLVIFDADADPEQRRSDILKWGEEHGVTFSLFLLPNDHDGGALEDLLERIINPDNRPLLECWHRYEEGLRSVVLPWRGGRPLTLPAKKTKIYAYLEALLGPSRDQKRRIKEMERDYKEPTHWNLHADALQALAAFLTEDAGRQS